MKPLKNAQSGLNLLELLLVLAIVSGIAVIAFIVFPRVQSGQQAAAETQILAAAQAGSKALFPTNNYAGLNNTVANNADLFPQSMDGGGAIIANQFNGQVDIMGTNLNDGSATVASVAGTRAPFIQVSYAGVPREVCLKLGASAANNWGAVYVGGVLVSNRLDAVAGNDVVDASALTLNCDNPAGAVLTLVSN